MVLVISEQIDDPYLLYGIYVSIKYREWRVLWLETSRLLMQGFSSLVVRGFNYIVGSHDGGLRLIQGQTFFLGSRLG